MSSSNASTHELLAALAHNPHDDELLSRIKTRIRGGDEEFDSAAASVHSVFTTVGKFVESKLPKFSTLTWSNCINQQTCSPSQIKHPKSLQDLVDAVNEGRKSNISVRAVGSGHSFSNVAPTFDGGILLDPHGMSNVLEVDTDSLRDPGGAEELFSVESGITIADLNTALDKNKLGLINMGAYDGQTLAGAISTGTHGTGFALGPMASNVRAIVLVSETGTVYQIEPSNGISDPVKFSGKNTNMTLKQDDDWFYSVLISMGCMGLIYSYILEVMPDYYLEESRHLSTWETIKTQLVMTAGGPFPTVLTNNRHYDVNINPYPVDGVHSCIVDIKNISPGPAKGSRGVGYWLAGVLAGWPQAETWLVWFLNLFPLTSPEIINNALSSLVDSNYIDKSYKTLSVGAVDKVKALAIELAFPADETTVDAIDNLLAIFEDEAKGKKWYLAGPVALRFVARSEAYLAPQQGRYTCMAELDMLVGVDTGTELLKAVKERVAATNVKLRVHWGLDLDTVNGDEVRERYPRFPEWLEVYEKLNSTGMFDSPFTERLGISTKGKRTV
jgi:L-gulono-1,4-lactone dehydrogenase